MKRAATVPEFVAVSPVVLLTGTAVPTILLPPPLLVVVVVVIAAAAAAITTSSPWSS